VKWQYFIPYLFFFVPTVACTIFMIPRDWRMILGFSCCLAGMTAAYFFGIRNAVLDLAGGM
jgi:hypothetical protein